MRKHFKVLTPGNTEIEYQSFVFSGGEVQPKLFTDYGIKVGDPITIEARVQSAEDILELLTLTDALKRKFTKSPIKLLIPYLPYARQDRVMQSGEALGLRVMCNLINAQGYDSVEVWDVHSDVSLALLDRVTNTPPEVFLQRVWTREGCPPIYVAPDAGASKKVGKAAQSVGRQMVQANKKRDTRDGSITGTEVYSEHIGNRDFLIVDDICDGGKTFIELAKVLKPLTDGKIYLYVTHGIFSKGLQVFDGLIDHIYTANPFDGVDLTNPIITKLNLSV